MDLPGFIATVVLGGIAGFLGSLVIKLKFSVIGYILVGVVGALVGSFVFNLFGASGVNGFNLYSLLVAFVGSVIALFILKKVLEGRGGVRRRY